jgi:hypothetical protein
MAVEGTIQPPPVKDRAVPSTGAYHSDQRAPVKDQAVSSLNGCHSKQKSTPTHNVFCHACDADRCATRLANDRALAPVNVMRFRNLPACSLVSQHCSPFAAPLQEAGTQAHRPRDADCMQTGLPNAIRLEGYATGFDEKKPTRVRCPMLLLWSTNSTAARSFKLSLEI